MKVEVEVDDADLQAAVTKEVTAIVARTIASKVASFETTTAIRSAVAAHWDDAVQSQVRLALDDLPRVRSLVEAALKAKLQAQLTKLKRAG